MFSVQDKDGYGKYVKKVDGTECYYWMPDPDEPGRVYLVFNQHQLDLGHWHEPTATPIRPVYKK